MSLCPARFRRDARSRLREVCFGLLLLLLNGSCPADIHAQAQNAPAATQASHKVSITVCVSNETGQSVEVQPLLFNSPNKADTINQAKGGGCYASPVLTFKTAHDYFVAAVSEDKIAFKKLTFPLPDKDQPITLKLAKPDAQTITAIEICAQDEQGNSLEITDIKARSGNAQFVNEQANIPACYRVKANSAHEYPLALITRSKAATSWFPSVTVGQLGVLLSIIALAALALASIVLIKLRGIEIGQSRQENGSAHLRDVDASSGITRTSRNESAQWQPKSSASQSSLTDHDMNEQSDEQADAPAVPDAAMSANGKDEQYPLEQTTARHASNAETTSQELHQVDDIKARYLRFSSGDQIEHFYLTPSGASSASEMVEDAKVELLEQNKGSYVAFRSSDNESEAWVFPMPKMHFTAETFRAVFPHLTEAQYEAGNIEPKRALSPQPKLWKIQ